MEHTNSMEHAIAMLQRGQGRHGLGPAKGGTSEAAGARGEGVLGVGEAVKWGGLQQSSY